MNIKKNYLKLKIVVKINLYNNINIIEKYHIIDNIRETYLL